MAAIAIVEDNPLIREAVASYVQLDGHTTIEFSSIEGVMDMVKRNVADLLILDVMLPDGNGFSLTKSIRAVSQIPIIFLTAKDSESDRILGFELGADDYICKPFSAKELVLRVQALLRRCSVAPQDEPSGETTWVLDGSTMTIDVSRHELKINDQPITLTGAEWRILIHLSSHNGQVISRDQILSECLNYFFEGSERTVDTHIANLRSKTTRNWIETVRGYGYRFNGVKANAR